MDEQHRMFARHPNTTFINAHLGWLGNNLAELGRLMDQLPNMYTEIGAVLYELGRQPRAAREFLIKYQDRVLFGKDAWDPLFDDRRSHDFIMPIISLCSEAPEEIQDELTQDMRDTFLDQLPVALQTVAAYWRDPARGFPRREPVRSAKVGRNDPCPCGSGRKFKKCCGSGTPPMVH